MSLITSCPACGTMFRVVPDQLKISEGWVRCGHCSEVFDAAAHLSDESVLGNLEEAQGTRSGELEPDPPVAPALPPRTPSPFTSPAPTAAPLPLRRASAEPPTVPAELKTRPAELYERDVPAASELPETSDTSSDPSDFLVEEAAALEPSPLDAPFVFRRPEIALADLTAEPGREAQVTPEDLEDDYDREPLPNVSFVRQARRRALWRRPFVRLVLAALLLVLGAALALQVAYQDRDRLALAQPQLRPALDLLCDVFRCRLGPPRQIEAIVIDSSGFNRLRNDTYRLTFTLRNTAPTPVAVPAVELTITDSQEQTLARRVLTAAELGADNATIAGASDWSRTVGLVLDVGGAGRVSGYRLLAFYP